MDILTWQARQKAGLTLAQLARLTGISKSALNNIENGRTPPKLPQLEAIAKATGTKIQDLYNSPYK